MACEQAADADGNLAVNLLVDSLYLLTAGFVPGSPLPPAPYPVCGVDQNTTDVVDCDVQSCP